jgi:hypothetical protein
MTYPVRQYPFQARVVRDGQLIEAYHDCDLQAALWIRAFRLDGLIFVRAGSAWKLFKKVFASGGVRRIIPYFNDALCKCRCVECLDGRHAQCSNDSCTQEHCGCATSKLSPEEQLEASIQKAFASPPDWVLAAGIRP